MKFNIIFEYMDGKLFDVDIHKDDMEEFIECFGKGEVYFKPSLGIGLWIPMDKIRHFKVEAVDGKGKRIKKSNRKVSKSNEDLQSRACKDQNEGNEGVENPLQSPEALPVLSDGGVEERMTFEDAADLKNRLKREEVEEVLNSISTSRE